MKSSKELPQTHLPAFVFWAGLAIAECWLFLSRHFFQGDSVFLLQNRFASIDTFFKSFVTLDAGHWYRPLSHGTLPSVLFPFFRLEPAGYRIVSLLLFFAAGAAIFGFLRTILQERVAAGIALVFFSIHSVAAFVTYDLAFFHEMLYTLFYVMAATAFGRYVLTGNLKWNATSAGLFILTVLSKESGVTLPFVLITLGLFLESRPGVGALAAVKQQVQRLWAHWLVLSAYLVLVVMYLGVGGYGASFGSHLLTHYGLGLLWSLNVPVGWHAQWRGFPDWAIVFVGAAAALILLAICLGAYRRDRGILFGLVWFTVGVVPALPLYNHFIPYYLFLPLVGMALCVGRVCQTWHDKPGWRVALHLALGVVIVAGIVSIRNDTRSHPLLGGSSSRAQQSAVAVKDRYPKLHSGTVVFIVNDEQPDLWWDHGLGNLYKLLYSDPSIETRFSSLGDTISPDLVRERRAIVFKTSKGELTDITAEIAADPRALQNSIHAETLHYEGSSKALSVAPDDVEVGAGFYTLRVTGFEGRTVDILYKVNDGPTALLAVVLDPKGEISFFVSQFTHKGSYRFVAFKSRESQSWLRTNVSMRIR